MAEPLRPAPTSSLSRPMEGHVFHDPRVFDQEQETLFTGHWLCAGPVGELRAEGEWFTRSLGTEPLLFTRSGEGIHGFYNVCRHRGTRLVDGECGGGAKNFQCPYHAWTYALDGRLLGAPRMKDVEGFDPAAAPLVSVDTEVWNGFVFFRLGDDGPASPAAQLSGGPDLSPWSLDELVVAHRQRYDVAANWKLLCQNYGECYHCALVHPQLHDISHYLSGGEQESGESFVGGPMRLEEGCNTMNRTGRSERPNLPGVSGDLERNVYFYNLYPNFLLSLHRDYAVSTVLWPTGPESTVILCDWLFHPDVVEADGFDASSEVEFWDLTNRQDWEICEQTQIGVRSAGYRPVAYHDGESCLAEFDRWYRSAMGRQLEG